jgi:quercetin dioxygenase-like cupin family protein
VTKAAQAEQRVAPNGKARVTILARGLEAFVGRLEMDPGAAVPEHRDATEEYIHVLAGSGTITIDDHVYPLATGDTVYMPADAKVSFQNDDAPLVGLQVFAGPEPAAKYDAWTPAR